MRTVSTAGAKEACKRLRTRVRSRPGRLLTTKERVGHEEIGRACGKEGNGFGGQRRKMMRDEGRGLTATGIGKNGGSMGNGTGNYVKLKGLRLMEAIHAK
jgi:hypothetical protein